MYRIVYLAIFCLLSVVTARKASKEFLEHKKRVQEQIGETCYTQWIGYALALPLSLSPSPSLYYNKKNGNLTIIFPTVMVLATRVATMRSIILTTEIVRCSVFVVLIIQ